MKVEFKPCKVNLEPALVAYDCDGNRMGWIKDGEFLPAFESGVWYSSEELDQITAKLRELNK